MVNAKQNFTALIDTDYNYYGKYVVSSECHYKGTNPSIYYEILTLITKLLDSKEDSIGGWLDPDTGFYEVNTNKHFHDLDKAIEFAKEKEQKYVYDIVEDKNIEVK